MLPGNGRALLLPPRCVGYMGAVPHLLALHKDQGFHLHLTEMDKPRGTEVVKGDLGWRSAWFLPLQSQLIVAPNASEPFFILAFLV